MSFGTQKSQNKVDTTLETEQANIAREQYDDYLTRFKPVETEILNEINDDAGRERLVARSGEVSDDGFAQAAKSAAAQQSRMGFGPNTDPDVAAVGKRRLGLARALANVNTQNQTRTGLRDRLVEMTGKQISVGRNISASGTGGLSSAAQLEAAENARKHNANAQEDSNTQSAIGTGIGAVASMFSSRAYKKDIRPIDPATLLALIQQISTVSFEYKPELDMPGQFIGAIAEEVPEVFAAEDRTQLNGYNLIGALVGAVQALAQRVNELENA